MLRARDLVFRWRADLPPVVDGASLEVAPGEIVGIRGPSGGGKTTLARLLGGYVLPETGTVTLDGAPLPSSGPCPVQVLFQTAETAVDPRWSLRHTLREGHAPDEATIDAFGIDRRLLGRYPHEVSGGELQRVAIVRALVPQLRVLIADEMTAMLDPIAQASIWRTLLAVTSARAIGLVAISHDGDLLAALGARMLVFENGRLAAE
jgi:peptide/nickel transport system ATP-binding protein